MVNTGSRKLAAEMKRRKANQTQVAKTLNVSRAFVSQLLSGHRRPSLDMAVMIEREYRIPPRDFAQVA